MADLSELDKSKHDHANKLQALAVALYNCEKLQARYEGLLARCELAEQERDELRREVQALRQERSAG